jgi:hypothetical protein
MHVTLQTLQHPPMRWQLSKSYTTMTNTINGRIDANIVKPFGEIAQREYWM